MNKVLGWREWVSLPGLGLSKIKAKVDTGARTSCLHAFSTETFDKNNESWVRFSVHPEQGDNANVVVCEAPIADERTVTDSGGHAETRLVIVSKIIIGDWSENIELTLTNRDNMRFRMLLGRTSLNLGGFLVKPSASYISSATNTE